MDRKKLEKALKQELTVFNELCEKQGYPLLVSRIVPFDRWDGMYNIEVYAKWFDNMSMGEVLDILTDIKFQTISQEHRTKIFITKILDKESVIDYLEENSFTAMAVV